MIQLIKAALGSLLAVAGVAVSVWAFAEFRIDKRERFLGHVREAELAGTTLEVQHRRAREISEKAADVTWGAWTRTGDLYPHTEAVETRQKELTQWFASVDDFWLETASCLRLHNCDAVKDSAACGTATAVWAETVFQSGVSHWHMDWVGVRSVDHATPSLSEVADACSEKAALDALASDVLRREAKRLYTLGVEAGDADALEQLAIEIGSKRDLIIESTETMGETIFRLRNQNALDDARAICQTVSHYAATGETAELSNLTHRDLSCGGDALKARCSIGSFPKGFREFKASFDGIASKIDVEVSYPKPFMFKLFTFCGSPEDFSERVFESAAKGSDCSETFFASSPSLSMRVETCNGGVSVSLERLQTGERDG